jgi:hypothetical protein
MNSIIALHPRHNPDVIITAKLIGALPPELHFYPKKASTAAIPCISMRAAVEPTVDSIRATAVHETLQSILNHSHPVKIWLVTVPQQFRDSAYKRALWRFRRS